MILKENSFGLKKIKSTGANMQYKTMGFNMLHKHRAPQQVFVSADND